MAGVRGSRGGSVLRLLEARAIGPREYQLCLRSASRSARRSLTWTFRFWRKRGKEEERGGEGGSPTTLTTDSRVLTTCPNPLVINLIPCFKPSLTALSALTLSITSALMSFCFSTQCRHSAPVAPLASAAFFLAASSSRLCSAAWTAWALASSSARFFSAASRAMRSVCSLASAAALSAACFRAVSASAAFFCAAASSARRCASSSSVRFIAASMS